MDSSGADFITVGDLVRRLQSLDQRLPVIFGHESLRFERVKPRGDFAFVEFGQSFESTEDGGLLVVSHS